MRKRSYLETSPEKFQQNVGSGCCSTDSPTPTGSPLPVLVRPHRDSYLPTDDPLKSPLEDTYREFREKEPENFRESGENGETSLDLLQFWKTRIPVRQKG